MPNPDLIEIIESIGVPEVPAMCECGGKIVLEDYEKETYICKSCLTIY